MNNPAAELRGIKVLELIAITCHSGLDPESRVSCENRNPVHVIAPRFRGDDVWIPAFAGMTTNTDYTPMQSIEEFI